MNIPKRLWRAFSGRRPALCSEPSAEPFWEPRFDKLARYNTEVAHGLMHTPAHKARMKTMQSEYDAKLMAQNAPHGRLRPADAVVTRVTYEH